MLEMPTKARPIYYPALGRYFTNLRERRGWSQQETANIARDRGIKELSRDVLWRLEQGKIRFPDREVLEGLATIYDLPYEVVVSVFLKFSYGLTCHTVRTDSGDDEAPASARLLESAHAHLRGRIDAAVRRIDTLKEELGEITASLRDRPKPRHARRHKTG